LIGRGVIIFLPHVKTPETLNLHTNAFLTESLITSSPAIANELSSKKCMEAGSRKAVPLNFSTYVYVISNNTGISIKLGLLIIAPHLENGCLKPFISKYPAELIMTRSVSVPVEDEIILKSPP
jgi:hypothetical protein